MLTRREFAMLVAGGFVIAPARLRRGIDSADSTVNGVRLGVQTYSFRELPRTAGRRRRRHDHQGDDRVRPHRVRAVRAAARAAVQRRARRRGAPPSPEAIKAREDLRKWRLETPLDHFRDVEEEVRRGRHHDLRLQLQPERQLHRRGDRSRLRDDEGARRRHHHDVDDAGRGEADRADGRQAQDDRRDARSFPRSTTRTSSRRRRASPRR